MITKPTLHTSSRIIRVSYHYDSAMSWDGMADGTKCGVSQSLGCHKVWGITKCGVSQSVGCKSEWWFKSCIQNMHTPIQWCHGSILVQLIQKCHQLLRAPSRYIRGRGSRRTFHWRINMKTNHTWFNLRKRRMETFGLLSPIILILPCDANAKTSNQIKSNQVSLIPRSWLTRIWCHSVDINMTHTLDLMS